MRRTRRQSGFTLIEIVITVAILALGAAVVAGQVSNVTLAELRSAAGQLSGVVRRTYDLAALSGEPYRLVLTPGKGSIKIERGSSQAASGAGLMGLAALAMGGGDFGEADEDEPIDVPPPTQIMALFGGTMPDGSEPPPLSAGLSTFAAEGEGLELGEHIAIMDVWLEGMSEVATEGTVYLNFFPHGYTQNALIHLTETDGAPEERRIFTIEVKALTGKTAIFAEYVQVPK